jgi:chaperone modulatory protein CbpM
METTYLIAISDLCSSHNIELSFIDLLQEYGLVEFTWEANNRFIQAEQLETIEKYIHLHYDLEINIEGIETISHLLDRITALQHEITTLKNKLRLYEGEVE